MFVDSFHTDYWSLNLHANSEHTGTVVPHSMCSFAGFKLCKKKHSICLTESPAEKEKYTSVAECLVVSCTNVEEKGTSVEECLVNKFICK